MRKISPPKVHNRHQDSFREKSSLKLKKYSIRGNQEPKIASTFGWEHCKIRLGQDVGIMCGEVQSAGTIFDSFPTKLRGQSAEDQDGLIKGSSFWLSSTLYSHLYNNLCGHKRGKFHDPAFPQSLTQWKHMAQSPHLFNCFNIWNPDGTEPWTVKWVSQHKNSHVVCRRNMGRLCRGPAKDGCNNLNML
jgi:hypothetical protein